MKRTALLTTFLAVISFTFAQQMDVTHFLTYQTQHYTDPARLPLSRFYISFPALGNLHVGLQNSSFRYKKLFETDAEGYPVKITPNTFVNSLAKKDNYLNFAFNEEILAFGFRTQRLYFGFNYRIRANMDFSYSKDLFGFFVNGNMHYLGESNAAQMELGINANVYNEFALNMGLQLENLSVGVRPKFLVGMLNVQTNKIAAQIHTNPDDYSIFMTYKADVQCSYTLPSQWTVNLDSMKVDFPMDDFKEMDMAKIRGIVQDMMRNRGFGVDIGARYTPIKKLTVAASMLDWGYIKWNVNTYKASSLMEDGGKYYNNGGFLFQGLTREDIDAIQNGTFDGEALADSLKNYFSYEIKSTSSYTVTLQPRYVLQVDYDPIESFRITAVAQGNFQNHTFRPAFTVALDKRFLDILDVCAAYTLSKKSFDNLAVGVAVKLGFFNFYLATQSILPAIDITNFSKITLTAGMSLQFGSIVKKEEKEWLF